MSSKKKYILVPDSFKGSLSSTQICQIMRERILCHDPESEVFSIPVADGGEGSVDCFLQAVPGEKIYVQVTGPFLNEKINTYYALIDSGKTAVIETASCAGLPLVEGRQNPCETTTFGLGELILDAVNRGAKTIILGLGGSATNDGGCGMAAAIGVAFYNTQGQTFVPTGGTLSHIERIENTKRTSLLQGISVICMCDIDNPMHGETGAATIFAPQKGAGKETVALLDHGLKHLDKRIQRDLNLHVADIPGAGAAGALGAGAIAFLHGSLKMGIDVVLDTVGFDKLLKEATMVFTGEGKIDSQSLRGKVVIGVARRAQKQGVPVITVVGSIDDNIESAYDLGVSAIFSINRKAEDFSISRVKSEKNLYHTMDNLLRFYKSFQV